MSKKPSSALMPVDQITRSIIILRGCKVILDSELAGLYDVSTKALLQAVKRNRARFPDDFMIQLSGSEWDALRSQDVTSIGTRGGRRYPPYAFTEQGVGMLSSVLRSGRAITVNIQIMRAFVNMRKLLGTNRELARRLRQLEVRLQKKLATHDEAIAAILSTIKRLMDAPSEPKSRRPMGFTADLDEKV